jgi:hypothetical protein
MPEPVESGSSVRRKGSIKKRRNPSIGQVFFGKSLRKKL